MTHVTPVPGGAPGSSAGVRMAAEIAEQPEVLARLLASAPEQIMPVAQQLERRAPRFVLIAARGTSDHAALYAKYLVEVRLGLPAGLVSPSTLTLYGARPDLSDVAFLAVSQSGSSPDLVDSVTAARGCGALTVAVTNDAASPLFEAAELNVSVCAGAELAVAATKSYTAELLALALLLGGTPAIADAHQVPDAARRTLGYRDGYAAATRYRFASRLVTTARGYSYPTAREAALKLMETSYLSAQAFSGADILHGPMAVIDAQVPVIAVVTPGRGGSAMQQVVERLRGAGADVLLVGGPDAQARGGEADSDAGMLRVATADLPEYLSPIVEILPLQQLAWQLALDRGQDPDQPRGLSKVTRTW